MSSFAHKVKAILAGDPPTKKAPAAVKTKALTLPSGDAHDNKVRDKVQPLAQTLANYVASPLYKARLQGMQVPEPEKVQAERLKRLGQIQTRSGELEKENLSYYGGRPVLHANKDTPRYTLMHELGHTFTDKPETQAYYGETPFTASGTGMSPVEAWRFVNRSNISPDLKKQAFNAYQQAGAQGQYANYSADPVMKVKPEGMDEHGVSTAEMKGDLEALRLLLLDNQITGSYGENLDAEKMKRLMNNPELLKEEHVQRLLKNFSPEDLIDLNNTIARKSAAPSNLA